MALPKKKISKTRSHRRHTAYVNRKVAALRENLNLLKCPECGEMKINHHVCLNCGKYRGKQIIDKSKEIDKITKIKA